MQIDIEYYNRFPLLLRKALIERKVEFPDCLERDYSDLSVYRGVKYSKQKDYIEKEDFLSNIERKQNNPMVPADSDDIRDYSCSCYTDLNEMRMQAKFPRRNHAIAKGNIKKEFGPIFIDANTSHVNLYLFDNVDPSKEFEVIEKWEKNG